MEILKQGRPPQKPNEDYRGECEHCGCQVKCKPTDPAVLPYSKSNPIYKVKCPTEGCGGFIHLTEYVTRDGGYGFVEPNVGQRA
jgi:hypothetical protein